MRSNAPRLLEHTYLVVTQYSCINCKAFPNFSKGGREIMQYNRVERLGLRTRPIENITCRFSTSLVLDYIEWPIEILEAIFCVGFDLTLAYGHWPIRKGCA